jgi:hypothetical protein
MKLPPLLAAFLVGLLPAPALSAETCDLGSVHSARDLHDLLSRRAVEIVGRAADPSWQSDERLAHWVAPSAAFGLGGGDVGHPLGKGIAGARALATEAKADTYRFLGWDYMDGPVDACADQQIDVEFIDTRDKWIAQVKFTFKAGRVVAADGWSRSFQSGPVAASSR